MYTQILSKTIFFSFCPCQRQKKMSIKFADIICLPKKKHSLKDIVFGWGNKIYIKVGLILYDVRQSAET